MWHCTYHLDFWDGPFLHHRSDGFNGNKSSKRTTACTAVTKWCWFHPCQGLQCCAGTGQCGQVAPVLFTWDYHVILCIVASWLVSIEWHVRLAFNTQVPSHCPTTLRLIRLRNKEPWSALPLCTRPKVCTWSPATWNWHCADLNKLENFLQSKSNQHSGFQFFLSATQTHSARL